MKAYELFLKQNVDNPLILTNKNKTEKKEYDFGLSKKEFDGGTQYGHGGDLDGYGSFYLFSPEHKVGLILLTSSGGNWFWQLGDELFYKLTNRKYTPPKKSIAQEFYNIISQSGFIKGKEWFEKNQKLEKYYLKEEEMNNVGYALIKAKNNDAIEVFKLNIVLFPKSANAYDSLGEAYLNNGNKELALENYKISIKLNPKNTDAENIIKKIRSERKN